LEWVETPGTILWDLAIDHNNNIIILGNTEGPLSLGANGESPVNIPNTAANYIAKYTSDRQLLWVYNFETGSSIRATNVCVDYDNNVIVSGWFSGTADFNAGTGVSYRNAQGQGDPFVVKLNPEGQFLWDACFTGPSFNLESIWAADIDQNNNIIVVGQFQGDVDFDPSDGVYMMSNSLSIGSSDVYVVKLSDLGNLLWAKALGGMQAYDVEIDVLGNVITTGNGTYSGDYDPGEGVFELTGSGFISKLSNDGDFIWAANVATCTNLGDECWANAQSVAIDSENNFYVTSTFEGAMDFDLGTGENYIYPSEPNLIWNNDIAVIKYSPNGEILWIKHIPCSNSVNSSLYSLIDQDGNLVVACSIEGSLELEPDQLILTANTNEFEVSTTIFKINPDGQVIWGSIVGQEMTTYPYFIQQDTLGTYYSGGFFSSSTMLHTTEGDAFIESVETNNEGLVFKFTMSDCAPIAHVYNDFNQNCENTQVGVSGVLMQINPGNFVTTSNYFGDFYLCEIDLPDGQYAATINPESMGWVSGCGIEQTFEVMNGEVISEAEFFIYNENPCPLPNISIVCPTMRLCSENTWPIYLSACNNYSASGALESAYAVVEFDEGILIESAEVPYVDLGNNTYQFELGNLNPGQCLNTTINANFSCDLELGETLCMEATLYPVPDCTEIEGPGPGECTEPWDHSSLEVEGDCDEDTGLITFTIENDGEAMVCSSEVRVYVDGELFETHYIQLGAESDTTFTYPTNGGTWILQADQHPLHPGNSHPNDHVEGCGDIEGEGDGDDDDEDGDDDDDDEWEPGLVDDLPCGDESPFVDVYCGQVVGSYDPNDKQGFPTGVGETHDVLPNEQIQYLIRFQNTGTAPAYTVVIRDTLDTDLDIFSVTPGVSSHEYSFTMYGERVLQWTFNNIMLPDSFSNEEQSHGFITYTVNQMADLTDGTEITNSAAIYFDSNEPVITNTTLHTINYCLFKDTHATIDATSCGAYIAPDGQVYDQSGTYTAVLVNAAGCDSTITIHVQSIDLNPQVEGNGSGTLTASPAGLNYQWIDCSTNTIIEGATAATLTGSNGIYAVQVSDGVCMEQSECAELVGVGELSRQSIRIYPIPASQQITAMWNGDAVAYTITAPDGRMILSGRLNPGANAIDVSSLAAGNYFLKAENRVKRFVVR
jgi:uncharacterized repeat protein (TIGR01451 family)